MNLIIISDIHEDKELIGELKDKIKSEKLGKDNLILIAGGLGYYSIQREKNYIEKVKECLKDLLEISSNIIYVTGDTDKKELDLQMSSVTNVHDNHLVLNTSSGKIGIFGYGGAPKFSVRKDQLKYYPNLWDEKIMMDDIKKSLKISYEKVRLSNPDYVILLTHSPPYNFADYSKEISFDNTISLEDYSVEQKDSENKEKKKKSSNPKHLGSKTILQFIKEFKIDLFFCNHIFKEGGKILNLNNTLMFNVSHLTPVPHRIFGRKFLIIKDLEKKEFEFHSVTNKNLNFEEYIEKYL